MREIRWERMFPDELEAAFAAWPLVYFPYGICEPHGPQCALGLDGLKVHAIACEASRAHGGIVAPMDWWHIHELSGYACWSEKSVGEVPRTWLTAMPPWQHFKNICYHIRNADVQGFHAAILLTGHYGPNWEDLKTLVELVQPHVGTRLYSLPDFEANQPGFDRDGQHGTAGPEVGLDEVPAVEAEHPVQHVGAAGGLLHLCRDIVGGVIDCLAEQLGATAGEVVVGRAARSAAVLQDVGDCRRMRAALADQDRGRGNHAFTGARHSYVCKHT